MSATRPIPPFVYDDAVLPRFLARVRALTPTHWGELDAAWQRIEGDGPLARWRRAQRFAALLPFTPPPARSLMTLIGFTAELSSSIEWAVAGKRRMMRRMRSMKPPAVPNDSPIRPFLGASADLWEIAEAQPGGVRAGERLLEDAMRVLWMRPMLDLATVAELYAPAEPFIPIASLA